jgi:hypothetical protein
MYVERVLSLNNGWSILTTQKSEEWAEAQAALELIDDDFILQALNAAEQAVEDSGDDDDELAGGGFIPYFIYNMYNDFLEIKFSWTDTLPTAKSAVKSQLKPKAMKNRVSASTIEADAMQTEDFLTSLYVTIPYNYNSGLVDISIILIPTTDTIAHVTALNANAAFIAKLPSEEACRAELAKFGSPTSQAPVVLAFFSPAAPEQITVEEVPLLRIGGHTVERTIEFAPEYYQAGVGLLSYFGEVLRQKDPSTKAKVRIEQDGRIVRLHIESPAGEIETIEKELDQYALVISNQAPPETLFEQRMHIMQLESRLEVAKVELKNAHDLKQLTDGMYSYQLRDLQQKVESLTQQVAKQILDPGKHVQLGSSYEQL